MRLINEETDKTGITTKTYINSDNEIITQRSQDVSGIIRQVEQMKERGNSNAEKLIGEGGRHVGTLPMTMIHEYMAENKIPNEEINKAIELMLKDERYEKFFTFGDDYTWSMSN